MTNFSLFDLEATIAERAKAGDGTSWTAKLVSGGMEMAAKKMGEEAVETVIAAIKGETKDLLGESADLLYHWLVVMHVAGISLSEVVAELERRTGQSGIAEKAAREER